MSSKKYSKIMMFTSTIFLLIFAAIIFISDPFFHYHKLWFGLKPVSLFETYGNSGMIKNFEYDSIVVGSSLTQNFRASWFSETFNCNAIKATYSSGNTKNYNYIFELAFKNKKRKIENIFLGLDIYALMSDSNKTLKPLPLFLYDRDPFNDVSYLLNKEIMMTAALPSIANKVLNLGEAINIDELYAWEFDYAFSKDVVLKNHVRSTISPETDINKRLLQCQQNLEKNIIPFIKNNPDTQFYVFFPPYSIVYWDNTIRSGELSATFAILEYTLQELLQYENVTIYYFQNIEEIITNLDNYMDYLHYSLDINKFMLECMANGKYLITKENYIEELEKMKMIATNYDYEALFGKD